MRRIILAALLLCLCSSSAMARGRVAGWCQDGNYTVSVPGGTGASTNRFQRSFPSCTVTVYLAGTVTLASLFSDDSGTVRANPFTAAASGQWFFYADDGRYDVRFSGGGIATPFTLGDFNMIDAQTPWLIRRACTFTGADIGVQIAAAHTDLPAGGGVIDARCSEGTQTLTRVVLTKPTVLLLGAGSYNCSTTADCISHTAGNGTQIVGLGPGTTTVRNNSTGNVIASTNATELVGVRVANLTIEGNGTAAVCLDTQNWKDSEVVNFSISGCLSHGIDLRGADNLNNVIHHGRIVAGSGALKASRGVNVRAGNRNAIREVYFNIGGTVTMRSVTGATNASPIVITTGTTHGLATGDTATIADVLGNTAANGEFVVTVLTTTTFELNGSAGNAAYTSGGTLYWNSRWSTAVDARGASLIRLDDNAYDGVVHAVRTNTTTVASGEYLTIGALTIPGTTTDSIFGYYPASNALFVEGLRNSNITRALFNQGSAPLSDKYISISLNNGQNTSGTPGVLTSAVITPAQITANQDDYLPVDSTDATLLGRFASFWRLNSDGTIRQITGIGGGSDGKRLTLVNTGSTPLRIMHNSSSSVAANRIRIADQVDTYIRPREFMELVYDNTSTFWREVVPNASAGRNDDTLSPAQITANQNNYAPASAYYTHFWRLTSDASRNITGIQIINITAQQGTVTPSGYMLTIANVGSNNIVLVHNSGSSSAENRILVGSAADITLGANDVATLIYDAVTQSWRAVSVFN